MNDVFFDIETTGISPYYDKNNPNYGKIISFGFKENGEYKIINRWDYIKEDKEDVIAFYEEFYNHWKKLIYDRKNIIGYNVLKFDIPFIMCSTHCLKMKSIKWRWDMLFNNRIKDIFQKIQTSGEYIYEKLNSGERKTCLNNEVPELYDQKEYDKIVEHLKEDLDLTEKAFEQYY